MRYRHRHCEKPGEARAAKQSTRGLSECALRRQAHCPRHDKRGAETGSALVYILIAIALLAALTVSFMEPSSQQTTSQNAFKSTASLQGQVDTIRSAIQECVLLYGNGDGTINESSTTDPGYNRPYPLNPNSTHLPTAGSYRASDRLVSHIRCPGTNDGLDAQHKLIFTGSGGKFMPPPPDLFDPWQYYNGPDGVFYWIETDKSDAFLRDAMTKLDGNFGTCETDVIDASGGAEDLDNAGTVECSNGSLCFRVWLVTDTETSNDPATSLYPTETTCNTP